jgi:hypothetical protein
MKKLYVFVLLILPAALLFTAVFLHNAHGPYWLSYNSDPEYLYLISSLTLAESKQTGSPGHPGSTLQILGAATLKISHALDFSEKDSLEFTVLKNPEFYLTIINTVLVTLNTLLLFIIGLTAFILTKNIWLSLLLQFSPFLSNNIIIDGLPRISPEPLLFFTGSLFLLILLKMIFSKNLSKSDHWYMIILALVSGFGMATKLTFVPLLIIPLVVLPKLRNKIWFLFLTVLSFVFWTLPIISQYEVLFNWYCTIITHAGFYGNGIPEILNLPNYFNNIINLCLLNPLLFLVWFFSAGFILRFGCFSAGGDKTARKLVWQDTSFRTSAAVAAAQMFAVLIVAKHPAGWYLAPVFSLSGFMLFLTFLYLQKINYFNNFNLKKGVFFIGIILLFSCAWRIVEIRNLFMQKLQIKQESLTVHQKVESDYKDYLKINCLFDPSYGPSSSPISALAFGDFFVNEGRYSEHLRKIYGNSYFYNALDKTFYIWAEEFAIEKIILRGNGNRIVFHLPALLEDVDKIICRSGSILHLRDVFGGQTETIYVLEGITLMWEKQFIPPPVVPFPMRTPSKR